MKRGVDEHGRVALDRPTDGWIWSRCELLAGSCLARRDEPFALRITCGGRELRVRRCLHPSHVGDDRFSGFWTLLALQEHLDTLREGLLTLDVAWGDDSLGSVRLRVSPVAAEIARSHPLDLASYPVPQDPDGVVRTTLVFPGLGAVGGSSLNLLMRMRTLHDGGDVPIYDEANSAELWSRICALRPPPAFRWIDGHLCYDAARQLPGRAARITVLRDPIARTRSLFDYGRLVHPREFPWTSFDDFAASDSLRRYSQAVGLLRAARIPVDPTMPSGELYDAARAELRRSYALVGVTELFEETIFSMCRLAGHDSIGMWWRVLAAPRSFEVGEMRAETRVRLEHAFAADVRLHEEARASLLCRVRCESLAEPLRRYKAAAERQPELAPSVKATECLRWRLLLTESGAGV